MTSVVNRPARRQLSLGARLAAGAIYVAALVVLALWAHDGWPPASSAGFWFYSAALGVLVAAFVSEPFYTSPKAALGSSAALIVVAATFSSEGLQASKHLITLGRIVVAALAALVFVLAATAIFTRDRFDRVNRIAFPLAVTLGAGYLLYGVAYFGGVYASFADTPSRLAILIGAPLLLSWNPAERAIRFLRGTTESTRKPSVARIVRTEDPGVAILHCRERGVAVGQNVRTATGAIGLVVDLTETVQPQQARVAFSRGTVLRAGATVEVLPLDADSPSAVLGYIDTGTTLSALRIAAPSAVSVSDVEEGRLLSAPIRGQNVLFQVTGAAVQEEALGGEEHSRYQISAQKLGAWNEASAAFDLVPWLPEPNTAVRLESHADAQFDPDGIGLVPGSPYAVRFDPMKAVTFNTAILGILGSGKTTLARELVCRTIRDGMKVLVLDITGEYEDFFDTLVPAADAASRTSDIESRLSDWHDRDTQDEHRFWGSCGEFSRQMSLDIKDFLAGPDPLRIYNPVAFTATTKEGFASSSGTANVLRHLSAPEKTSLIASALLEAAQESGRTDQGRVCLVIEEAHSLTPEPWDGLNQDDKAAVNKTARAVLQGRKYGYGCILITQRTANVSKTILNQCQTVFALRSYDQTGMAFLANYLGGDYVQLLSTMQKYHCVAFGQGVSSDAPILIRLNDPAEFLTSYWQPSVEALRPPPSPAPDAEVAPDFEPDPADIPSFDPDADDDIPF
jgi:uncharacterized protein